MAGAVGSGGVGKYLKSRERRPRVESVVDTDLPPVAAAKKRKLVATGEYKDFSAW